MYSSHRYPAGHIFFEEGSTGASAHIIKSGQVEISLRQGGKEIVLDVCGPGEIFGEMALLGAQTRTATAKAIEKTEVINISRARLQRLLREGDALLRHLVLTLVHRLKKTNTKIRPEQTDDLYLSVCRILALIANQKSDLSELTDENGNSLLPYAEAVKQIRGILSIDASDCQSVLERLETFNLIEIMENRASSQDRFIRLIDDKQFLQRAQRASQELGTGLPNYLNQKSVYIDLFDLAEKIGVERKKIYKKIGEAEFPEALFLFKKEEVLKWVEKVGSSFFDKKKRISADELDSLDAIVYVRNSILNTVLSRMDFYKICQLLNTADEPVREKILSNLPGRLKQVVEQEMDLIEEVDPDEVEETAEDLLDEIRDLMQSSKQRGVSGEGSGVTEQPKDSSKNELEEDTG